MKLFMESTAPAASMNERTAAEAIPCDSGLERGSSAAGHQETMETTERTMARVLMLVTRAMDRDGWRRPPRKTGEGEPGWHRTPGGGAGTDGRTAGARRRLGRRPPPGGRGARPAWGPPRSLSITPAAPRSPRSPRLG